MAQITEIDENFQPEKLSLEKLKWINIDDEKIQIYGTPHKQKKFTRLDDQVINVFTRDIQLLQTMTSGIRIRFKTMSQYVAINAVLTSNESMPHMADTGISGFDLYCKEGEKVPVFRHMFKPDLGNHPTQAVVKGECFLGESKEREIILNFPTYNGVKSLEIGIDLEASVEKSTPYHLETPILFYGSSITQGGCASRPGNSYPMIISRWMDTDIINLGFSGNAKGEPEMASYIANLSTSMVVIDYDHNAPTLEELDNTHNKFFSIIRENNPHLPILMISKPDFDSDVIENSKRRAVIYKTYLNAKKKGDDNVYFLDGECLFGEKDRDSCTVDGCHPNDLGFMRMAERIAPIIQSALRLEK